MLFVDAELRIVAGRRYGLIGPNGMGKSTVMKMLAVCVFYISDG